MSAGDSELQQNAKDGTEDSPNAAPDSGTVQPAGTIRDQMMQNPQVLAALQQQLDNMVGATSGYVQTLPMVVRRRIKALKNIQQQTAVIESEFYKDVHYLEQKYSMKYEPLNEKRKEIVSGRYEPNDDECIWESDEEDEEDEKEMKEDDDKKLAEEKDVEEKLKLDETVKGIPSFWLTIFKSSPVLQEMVQEHDEPILECLEDIKVVLSKPEEPMAFMLEFHFSENPYFTDKMLLKKYHLTSDPDENDPFSFEGPEITSSDGCKINWVQGKNVTMKTVKKRQKHKQTGTMRTVTKESPADSFFNFFDPPQAPEDNEDMDEEMEALLASDIEIGHLLRERVIPRAVLFFTGEASDDDDDDEYDDDEDSDAPGLSG